VATKRVLIRGKGGEEYSVTEATFRNEYEEQGYKIVSYEDGTEYEEKDTSAKADKE
jgi:hypothetical protein